MPRRQIGAMLAMLLTMQAVTPTIMAGPPDRSLDRFDLAKAKPRTADCGEDRGDEIVICGRKKELNFDTSRMGDFAETKVRAGIDLPGGGRAAVTTQQVDVGGSPSRRVMAGIKLPF